MAPAHSRAHWPTAALVAGVPESVLIEARDANDNEVVCAAFAAALMKPSGSAHTRPHGPDDALWWAVRRRWWTRWAESATDGVPRDPYLDGEDVVPRHVPAAPDGSFDLGRAPTRHYHHAVPAAAPPLPPPDADSDVADAALSATLIAALPFGVSLDASATLPAEMMRCAPDGRRFVVAFAAPQAQVGARSAHVLLSGTTVGNGTATPVVVHVNCARDAQCQRDGDLGARCLGEGTWRECVCVTGLSNGTSACRCPEVRSHTTAAQRG